MSTNLNAHLPRAAFDTLAADLHGEVALPGSHQYRLARPWNLAVSTHPVAVVVAADVDDVQHAVRWAAAHDLRVAVHATGHGGVSQGSDVLVIHTGGLQQCSIDVAQRTAHFGAGVLAEQLLDATHECGLAPVIGSTGTVGVAGYLSGGGIGPLVSTFGLSSDYIRALEVVTADGVLHHVTAEQNSDLYWAMRGGKGAVGIITSVWLELLDLTTVYGGTLHFAAFDAADVMNEWARWSAQLPDQATTSLALTNMPRDSSVPAPLNGRFVASVRFATPAGRDEAEVLLADMRRVAAPIVDTIGPMPYRELAGAYGNPPGPVPVHQDQRLLTALTPDTVRAILLAAGPDSGSPLTEVELRRLGGVFARQPKHSSAFSHRDSPYSLGVTRILADAASPTVGWADRLLSAVDPWSHGATMANFVDTTDPTMIARAYDPATLDRLRQIAEKFDSTGVFGAAGELQLGRRASMTGQAAPAR